MSVISTGIELEGWPYETGESPYRLKGIGFDGHLKWTDANFPGGRSAMLELLDPRYRDFFEQSFLATAFYDLYPLCLVGREMARAMKVPYLEFVRTRTRWQADRDLTGIYRILLKAVSAERVARLVPGKIQQIMNFGTPALKVIDKGHVAGEASGIPMPLLPWWSVVLEEYAQQVMVQAHADRPHVTVRRGEPGPSRNLCDEASIFIDIFFHAE